MKNKVSDKSVALNVPISNLDSIQKELNDKKIKVYLLI